MSKILVQTGYTLYTRILEKKLKRICRQQREVEQAVLRLRKQKQMIGNIYIDIVRNFVKRKIKN